MRAVRAALSLTVLVAACNAAGVVTGYGVPEDVQQALEALPRVDDVVVGDSGIPTFLVGDLGSGARVDTVAEAESRLQPALQMIAPVFRLRAGELRVVAVRPDSIGMTHVRYRQVKDGLDVVGGDLIIHMAADGVIQAVTASARGESISSTPSLDAVAARAKAQALTPVAGANAEAPRLVYVISSADGRMHLAWESRVVGVDAEGTPVDDLVFVDAHDGGLADRHPRIHSARNRRVHSANNGSSLPGTLKRQEGGAASGDSVVDAAYDHTGTTYDCYKALFNRDSFNAGGATLTSTVHYSSNYVNAYWNGSQMVFGDGDGSTSGPLAKSLDITAHELTHAVTQYEANLVYQNEPGALNEGMSDIMSAVCEAWKDGGVSADTWKLGEDVWTPGTAGDALRYMNDPIADGASKDYYPTRYTGSQDNGGVHWNSGIANLAFKLLVTGGSHPRGKTSVNVPGIGIDKAGQIFYRALASYMTSNTSFAGARTATAQAAQDLYGASEKYAVEMAWAAVGVGSVPSPPGGEPPPPTEPPPTEPPPGGGDATPLANGVTVTGLGGATGSWVYYKVTVPAGSGTTLTIQTSGGSGDADLYVKNGAKPTESSWDYRPYRNGNAETVQLDASAGGTWYVGLHGYSAYSGMSLVASWSAGGGGGGGGNTLEDGVPVTGLSGAQGSTVTYSFTVPAGASSLQVAISGGSGDADIYVRRGAPPTTSTWDYRPYLNGNNETVTVNAPASGTWYVMVRGYRAYSGVTLSASW